MASETCQSCKHFTQHYYIDSQYAAPLDCGHCKQGRPKHRKPGTPACKYYAVKTTSPDLPDRAGLIRYLTTDFLKQILQMQLPPEITAEDEGFDKTQG